MDVRCGEDTIMMALLGVLEKEEDRKAMHRMMEEVVRRGGVASASPSPRGGGVHCLHRDAGNLAKHKVPWR